MMNWIRPLSIIAILFNSFISYSQCDSVIINLTGAPDSVWVGGSIPRNGQCCGATGGNQCLKFVVTLDVNSAGISFDLTGAYAYGSLFWKLGCGPQRNMRDTVCVSGVGPHRITFCKPGSNDNGFLIRSIAKPTFPANDSIRVGCDLNLVTVGATNVHWNSVFPGGRGYFNYAIDSVSGPYPFINPDTILAKVRYSAIIY